jgi:hypothetical protein
MPYPQGILCVWQLAMILDSHGLGNLVQGERRVGQRGGGQRTLAGI